MPYVHFAFVTFIVMTLDFEVFETHPLYTNKFIDITV